MRPQHGVLNRLVGVLIGHAAAARHTVQLGVVAAEQFFEGAPIAGRVGRQQVGIAVG